MIKTFDYKNHTIGIYESDPEDESPREYDPLGILLTFHRTMDWTDSDAPKLNPRDFKDFEEMKEYLINNEKAIAIQPVYMLDHSGQTISVKPFVGHAMDSFQIGFIYTTRERYQNHRSFKRLTKKLIEGAEQALIAEIETLDQYIRGEAYGWVIDPENDDDEVGLIEEYAGGYWDTEMAEASAIDCVDGLTAMDEEIEFIKGLPDEELPKYINHKWKFQHISEKTFKERLKCLHN